jgi:hypothetical protein
VQAGNAADWLLVADTGLAAPGDFVEPADRKQLASPAYLVCSRSVVVLCRKQL